MRKVVGEGGFSFVEIIVICVIMGILAIVMVPRFIGGQDRAKIGAAKIDLDQIRIAISLFEVDNLDYPTSNYHSLAAMAADLVNPDGQAYVILPDGSNFASFYYEYNGSVFPSTYTIDVKAIDAKNTRLVCTPEGIYQQ